MAQQQFNDKSERKDEYRNKSFSVNSRQAGKIVEIIGAVVDVEFPRGNVPKIYDAMHVEGDKITFEVQQQLGDGVVRTIAMGTTEGFARLASR